MSGSHGDNIIAEAGDCITHRVERPVVTTLLTADTGTIPLAPGACLVHTPAPASQVSAEEKPSSSYHFYMK